MGLAIAGVAASTLVFVAVPLTFRRHFLVFRFVGRIAGITLLGVFAGTTVLRLALESVVALLAVRAVSFLRSIVAVVLGQGIAQRQPCGVDEQESEEDE